MWCEPVQTSLGARGRAPGRHLRDRRPRDHGRLLDRGRDHGDRRGQGPRGRTARNVPDARRPASTDPPVRGPPHGDRRPAGRETRRRSRRSCPRSWSSSAAPSSLRTTPVRLLVPERGLDRTRAPARSRDHPSAPPSSRDASSGPTCRTCAWTPWPGTSAPATAVAPRARRRPGHGEVLTRCSTSAAASVSRRWATSSRRARPGAARTTARSCSPTHLPATAGVYLFRGGTGASSTSASPRTSGPGSLLLLRRRTQEGPGPARRGPRPWTRCAPREASSKHSSWRHG